jgi:hypothetical protein
MQPSFQVVTRLRWMCAQAVDDCGKTEKDSRAPASAAASEVLAAFSRMLAQQTVSAYIHSFHPCTTLNPT